MVIVNGSPRDGGVTDTLIDFFIQGTRLSDARVKTISLRRHKIVPCRGCEACAKNPYRCVLEKDDEVAFLYGQLLLADMLVFASPIFFYGLPAHFKAFIDRSQYFWHKWQNGWIHKKTFAQAILCAGRKKGPELFNGVTRTLVWFGKALNLEFFEPCLFYGLENRDNISENPQIEKKLYENGKLAISRIK